jgi:hypothetical protein
VTVPDGTTTVDRSFRTRRSRVLVVETLRKDNQGNQHPVDLTIRDPATLAIRQRLPKPDSLIWRTWLNHDGSLLATTHQFDNHVERGTPAPATCAGGSTSDTATARLSRC